MHENFSCYRHVLLMSMPYLLDQGKRVFEMFCEHHALPIQQALIFSMYFFGGLQACSPYPASASPHGSSGVVMSEFRCDIKLILDSFLAQALFWQLSDCLQNKKAWRLCSPS